MIFTDYSVRFWSKVARSDECWLWAAGVNSGGYGAFRIDGVHYRAHRVAWQLAFGPIPDGLFVCHRCDVRRCVRPGHLFLGTNADNMRDCAEKGRAHRPLGELSAWSKLTMGQVQEIRASTLLQRELAETHQVTQSQISRIRSGKAWPHAATT